MAVRCQIQIRCWTGAGLSIREQAGDDGYAPFVFEVAGSSVAVAVTASAQTFSREGRLNMLSWMGLFNDGDYGATVRIAWALRSCFLFSSLHYYLPILDINFGTSQQDRHPRMQDHGPLLRVA